MTQARPTHASNPKHAAGRSSCARAAGTRSVAAGGAAGGVGAAAAASAAAATAAGRAATSSSDPESRLAPRAALAACRGLGWAGDELRVMRSVWGTPLTHPPRGGRPLVRSRRRCTPRNLDRRGRLRASPDRAGLRRLGGACGHRGLARGARAKAYCTVGRGVHKTGRVRNSADLLSLPPPHPRNALKSECYSATVEAVGKDRVTGPRSRSTRTASFFLVSERLLLRPCGTACHLQRQPSQHRSGHRPSAGLHQHRESVAYLEQEDQPPISSVSGMVRRPGGRYCCRSC